MSSLVAEFAVSGVLARPPVFGQVSLVGRLLEAPPTVRAGVALVSTLLFGGGTLYWFGGRLGEAVDASAESLPLSLLYGVMAYVLVVFLVGYAFSQLSRIGAASPLLTSLLVAVLAVFVLSLVGYGFAVDGTWVADAAGLSDPWVGLVLVAGFTTMVWLVAPFFVGLLVWGAVAAVGLGGPARRWVHASEPRPNAE
jgi:hypothetical protein